VPLLALDTATPAVSAAVLVDGVARSEKHVVDGRRHGEHLAPVVAQVLAAAGVAPRDLTRVVVGVGPGPYTGLRVGVVTALTLGAALGIPVVGVCSLDAFVLSGRQAAGGGPFAVVTDARRREVYWARYDGSGRRVDGPAVDKPVDVAARLARDVVPVLGPATELYEFGHVLPSGPLSARDLAELLVAGEVEELPVRPLYLRRPDATPPGPRKAVLA
jgi:tRNA threonylcarbamoyl adenosine modification protein YeaZ